MIQDLKHQTEVFNRFKDSDMSALFMEAGTGKSRIIVKLAENHWKMGRIQAVVIVTTSTLVMNWSMIELPKHHEIIYHIYLWKRTKHLRITPVLYYFIMNVDGTSSYKFPPMWKEFLKTYPKYMLVVDESTFVKSHKADRTKAVTFMARRAAVRCIASGTPIVKSPMDLYTQCEILKPECLGFKSFYAFKHRYAVEEIEYNGVRSFNRIAGFQNLGELTTKLSKFSAIIYKKDCLDLPEKTYEKFHTEFSPEQAKAYTELMQYSITYIENHEITAVNAVSLINRLMQICCGQLKVNEQYISIKTPRLDALSHIISEIEGQVIVWNSFVQSSIDVASHLGSLALRVPAGLAPAALYSLLQSWRNGEYKVLVANPASLGHGITLVESSNVIYYSNTFNLEHRLQSEDRVHRIGQVNKVLYTDLITLGSIEERVLQVLNEKRNLANFVLNKVRLKWIIAGNAEKVFP